jgi:erythritol transport system substrate-binding protein
MTKWPSAPIAALKEAGKLEQVKVGGFDGSPDAVAAIKAGELQYTVLQPVAVFSEAAVKQADNVIKTGFPPVSIPKSSSSIAC